MSSMLSRQIMMRYLRGKRGANAVPLLSRISMIAIAVSACAMVILFSVFNGLGLVIKDRYKAFYPDIRMVAAKGKFFSLEEQQMQRLKNVTGISQLSTTIEDNVLMNNEGQDNQVISIKGVDNAFFEVNDFRPYIVAGEKSLNMQGEPGAIVGGLIMEQMGMEVGQGMNTITVHYPNVKNTNPSLNPTSAFTSLYLKPAGEFKVMDEFDQRYIIAPLPLVQQLIQTEGKYSTIEIKLKEGANPDKVKAEIQKITGNTYKVETRYEQNRTLYMVINTEKWAMYAILVLVLVIASFNMIGALSLLVIEKQKDIAILKAMGAAQPTIRNIFIGEGLLWSLAGGLSGIVVGLLLCLGQQQFEWIKMSGFIIDAYPVDIVFTDVLLVIATIVVVGILAAWYPSQKALKTEMSGLKS